MLSAQTIRAVPTMAMLCLGVTLAFGEWIARHPALVFCAACVVIGLFLIFTSIAYRLILILRGER